MGLVSSLKVKIKRNHLKKLGERNQRKVKGIFDFDFQDNFLGVLSLGFHGYEVFAIQKKDSKFEDLLRKLARIYFPEEDFLDLFLSRESLYLDLTTLIGNLDENEGIVLKCIDMKKSQPHPLENTYSIFKQISELWSYGILACDPFLDLALQINAPTGSGVLRHAFKSPMKNATFYSKFGLGDYSGWKQTKVQTIQYKNINVNKRKKGKNRKKNKTKT